MLFSNKKWNTIISASVIMFLLIMIFEIIPGYMEYSGFFISAIFNEENLNTQKEEQLRYNSLVSENMKLKNMISIGIANTANKNRLSDIISLLDSASQESGVSISLIKPGQTIKKENISSQRLEVVLNSKYREMYKYFQILVKTHMVIRVKELEIRIKEAKSDSLITRTVLEVYPDL